MKPSSTIWRQVITVHADGSISGLQRKPGDGLDLRQFGRADIRRASEILWNADAQAWTVVVLQEDQEAFSLTANRLYEVSGFRELPTAVVDSATGVLLFEEYAAAVDAEVFYLDSARLSSGKLN